MKKETKTITTIVLAVVIILALIWGLYATFGVEESSVNPANNLSNESIGLSDTSNSVAENAITNTETQNEVVNEVANEVVEEEANEQEATENDNSSSESESEVVSGTTTSREEKAVELAKQYYEEEYGSTDEVYFTSKEINSDWRYIVRTGNADSGTNMFLYVNIDKGEVSEN